MCDSQSLLRAWTGIVEMSRFHQLLAGNTEQPPTCGTVELAATEESWVVDVAGSRTAKTKAGTSRRNRRIYAP